MFVRLQREREREREEHLNCDTILLTNGDMVQLEDLSKESHEINYLEVITVQTFEQGCDLCNVSRSN